MPLNYSRKLTGRVRMAGATNAGGLLAVRQYTSHMRGIVSSMADNLALGTVDVALAGLLGHRVNYSRQHAMDSEFAPPLMLEAVLLLCFFAGGVAGALRGRSASSRWAMAPRCRWRSCSLRWPAF